MAIRCRHSMLAGLCTVETCVHFDGHTGSGPVPTLRTCMSCGNVLRGRGAAKAQDGLCATCRKRKAAEVAAEESI